MAFGFDFFSTVLLMFLCSCLMYLGNGYYEAKVIKDFALTYMDSAGSTHYGNPADGCLSDEKILDVLGVSGYICSPECSGDLSNGTCPTDVPEGVTAVPKCVLAGDDGNYYCAVVCNATDSCGESPCSCNIDKEDRSLSLCTYPDS